MALFCRCCLSLRSFLFCLSPLPYLRFPPFTVSYRGALLCCRSPLWPPSLFHRWPFLSTSISLSFISLSASWLFSLSLSLCSRLRSLTLLPFCAASISRSHVTWQQAAVLVTLVALCRCCTGGGPHTASELHPSTALQSWHGGWHHPFGFPSHQHLLEATIPQEQWEKLLESLALDTVQELIQTKWLPCIWGLLYYYNLDKLALWFCHNNISACMHSSSNVARTIRFLN